MSTSQSAEINELEMEINNAMARLQVYQTLSHITFTDEGNSNSNSNNNDIQNNGSIPSGQTITNKNAVMSGYLTLTSIGDLRPFEFDLNRVSPAEIQDLIWSWLYEEHCPE
jgi:hypothetical protein